MKNRHRASQAGLSLLELSVALAIGAVVVLLEFRQQIQNARLARLDAESKWVVAVMRDIPAQMTDGNYAKLSNLTLGAIRSVPPGYLDAKVAGITTVVNGFGGAVTVAPLSLGGGLNNAYALTYTNISQESCAQMVALFSKAGDAITAPIFGIVGKTGDSGPDLSHIGLDVTGKNIVLSSADDGQVLKLSTNNLAMDKVAAFCQSASAAVGQPRVLTLIRY
jgi:prepilin-type N-terminal cleavage/methylation domain-containing protein